jgi:hypothetical protein
MSLKKQSPWIWVFSIYVPFGLFNGFLVDDVKKNSQRKKKMIASVPPDVYLDAATVFCGAGF